MIDQLLKGLVIKTQLAFSRKKKKKNPSTQLSHVLEQGLAYIVFELPLGIKTQLAFKPKKGMFTTNIL